MVVAADQELTSHATASPSPTLQLLLRFLPFKSARTHPDQQTQQAERVLQQKLLEELHHNPLWRFSSLEGHRQAGLQALKHVVPCDAHDAFMAYVRLASAAEMRQPHAQCRVRHHSHQSAGFPVSPVEVAAELQALYRLVAAEQQQQQQPEQECAKQLSDAEVLQLLEAYVGLDSRCSTAGTLHDHDKRGRRHQRQGSWDNAAAAVKALHAFAQLADVAQQQQQQQQHAAHGVGQLGQSSATPTSMFSSKSTLVSKQGPSSAVGSGSRIVSNCGSANLAGTSHDVRALFELAELSSRA